MYDYFKLHPEFGMEFPKQHRGLTSSRFLMN